MSSSNPAVPRQNTNSGVVAPAGSAPPGPILPSVPPAPSVPSARPAVKVQTGNLDTLWETLIPKRKKNFILAQAEETPEIHRKRVKAELDNLRKRPYEYGSDFLFTIDAKAAYEKWGLKSFGLELSGSSFPLRLKVMGTDKQNSQNFVTIFYDPSVKDLSVSSPLCGSNFLMTQKTLEVMAKLMEETGNKNLKFDLQNFLNPQSSQGTKDLFKQVFQQDPSLQSRLCRADRALLGFPDPSGASQSSPSSKATFTAMGNGNPPARPPAASAPAYATKPISEGLEGRGADKKDDPFLQGTEVEALYRQVLKQNGFKLVGGERIGVHDGGLVYEHEQSKALAIDGPFTSIQNFFGAISNVLEGEDNKSMCPSTIVGIVAVGGDDSQSPAIPPNHYVALQVAVDEDGQVTAKVADSLTNQYLDGKQTQPADTVPGKDFEAIRVGVKQVQDAIGQSEYYVGQDNAQLLADPGKVKKQPDSGVACGLYSVRNALSLLGVDAPVGEIGKLQGAPLTADRFNAKDPAEQNRAKEVIAGYDLSTRVDGSLVSEVKGDAIARIWNDHSDYSSSKFNLPTQQDVHQNPLAAPGD